MTAEYVYPEIDDFLFWPIFDLAGCCSKGVMTTGVLCFPPYSSMIAVLSSGGFQCAFVRIVLLVASCIVVVVALLTDAMQTVDGSVRVLSRKLAATCL